MMIMLSLCFYVNEMDQKVKIAYARKYHLHTHIEMPFEKKGKQEIVNVADTTLDFPDLKRQRVVICDTTLIEGQYLLKRR